MSARSSKMSARLQELIHRSDKVLAVMHPVSATHGRVMEAAGMEAAFVGTVGTVGNYTGLGDVGTMTMSECSMVGGWIAQTLKVPVILDGDTGHGGIMAVRRLVAECIHQGIAGIRIDDQPIEGKRKTMSSGVEVVPLKQAIARYRAAVDMKNELDPNFVIMSQCYARGALTGGLDDTLNRLKAYKEEAGVDWVQFESPRSIDEVKQGRAAVKGPYSFMSVALPSWVSMKEHLEMGINIAWYPTMTNHVTWAALWDFMQEFNKKEIGAWEEFKESRKSKPYPIPEVGPDGEGLDKQRELEERYLSGEMLAKYKR